MSRHAKNPGPEVPQLPLLEAAAVDAQVEIRPTWRGWIHAGTFPVAVAAGIVLIVLAEGAPAKWAAVVFMATSLLLFGNSAVYHRFDWSPTVKVVLKRIDHANILLLIAGTYTPIAVLALPRDKGLLLLVLVWSGAVLGLASLAFVTWDFYRFRADMHSDLSTQAQLVLDNAAAAVTFSDPEAAGESLGMLETHPHTRIACLYLPGGRLFTSHDRAGAAVVSSRLGLTALAQEVEPDFDFWRYTVDALTQGARIDYFICDEAQFYTAEQVDQLAKVVDELQIDVFCFGILTDFRTRLFPGSARLVELADRTEVLQVEALCVERPAAGDLAAFRSPDIRGATARSPALRWLAR